MVKDYKETLKVRETRQDLFPVQVVPQTLTSFIYTMANRLSFSYKWHFTPWDLNPNLWHDYWQKKLWEKVFEFQWIWNLVLNRGLAQSWLSVTEKFWTVREIKDFYQKGLAWMQFETLLELALLNYFLCLRGNFLYFENLCFACWFTHCKKNLYDQICWHAIVNLGIFFKRSDKPKKIRELLP